MSLTKNNLNNFLKGYTSILNLYPEIQFPNRIELKDAEPNDSNSLRDDWQKIGKDLEKSIRKYENRAG